MIRSVLITCTVVVTVVATLVLGLPNATAQPAVAEVTIIQNSPGDPGAEFGYLNELFLLEDGDSDVLVLSADIPQAILQDPVPEGFEAATVTCVGDTSQLNIGVGIVIGIFAPGPTTCTFTNELVGGNTTDTTIVPAVTCLAGNGRVDVNIINNDNAAATYRLQVGTLPARQSEIAAKGWWRSPVTGRPDGPIQVSVTRNDIVVFDEQLVVACDTSPPVVTAPEIQIMNYCSNGNGFILAQMSNPTPNARAYILDVEGLRRSTTAAAYGAAVRGVSGRTDGNYSVQVEVGGVVLAATTVTVAC